MRKSFTMALLMSFVLLMAGCGGSGGAPQKAAAPKDDGKVYKLKVADAFPATHMFTVQGLNKFMQLAEEKSKGRLKFEHYPGGQLGKQVDMIELVKNGVADLAIIGPAYVSGKIPLSNVFDLPGLYPHSRIGAEAFWYLCQPKGILYEEEFKKHKLRMIFSMAYNPNDIFYNNSSGNFIKTPADIKGMRIRVPGVSADMAVSGMGGAPVTIIPQEMYEAALRGTVDGLLLAFEALDQYKIQEITKLATKDIGMNGWIGGYFINDRVFNGLPADLQQIMLDCGLEATKILGDHMTKAREDYQKKYEAAGMKVYTLNDAEKAVFKTAIEPVVQDWVKTQSGKGLPAQKVLDATRAQIAETEKKVAAEKKK